MQNLYLRLVRAATDTAAEIDWFVGVGNDDMRKDTNCHLCGEEANLRAILHPDPIKIDIGCGKNKREGFIGADQFDFPGVDVVCDLASDRWPWGDGTVSEAYCSHFLEHLTNLGGKWERVHFFNELFRVLQPGAKVTLILPHWASKRYYGDPTHKEPFSEMGFYYLSREWRMREAPHTDSSVSPNGYSCDFDFVVGYGLHPLLSNRDDEYKDFALAWHKEAALEIRATLTRK